jgi:transketolase
MLTRRILGILIGIVFILSKGHCAEALYSVLCDKGFIFQEELDDYGKDYSHLGGHPDNSIPGVEINTGALGHGLSIGVGMALAGKMNGKSYKTFVVMGDGEQAEGSIYEAALSASKYHLDNIVAVIDRNGLQIFRFDGRCHAHRTDYEALDIFWMGCP